MTSFITLTEVVGKTRQAMFVNPKHIACIRPTPEGHSVGGCFLEIPALGSRHVLETPGVVMGEIFRVETEAKE